MAKKKTEKLSASISPTGIWDDSLAQTAHVFSPIVADAIANFLDRDTPVLDLGCGNGSYVRHWQALGFPLVVGVEGTNQPDADYNLIQADLSEPLDWTDSGREYSVVSLEVGEHIPKDYESVFLDNLVRYAKDKVVLSWAVPGQGGVGHVNERFNTYIIRQMRERGFYIDSQATKFIRNQARKDKNVWWFVDSIMVFDRQ